MRMHTMHAHAHAHALALALAFAGSAVKAGRDELEARPVQGGTVTRSNACGGARGTFESGRVLYYELRDVADADPLVPSGRRALFICCGFRGVRITFKFYIFI